MTQTNLYTQRKQTHRHGGPTCGCQGEEEAGEGQMEIWG